MKPTILLCIVISLHSIWGCKHSDDFTDNTKEYSIVGFVQKGPFIQGSTITIQELNDNFNPTGKVFFTNTTDDFGSFKTKLSLATSKVQIIANGFYFNEVQGNLSESSLTLKAIIDLENDSNINVNILTTLIYDRVLSLVKDDKLALPAAKSQAENEFLQSLKLGDQTKDFEKLNITDNKLLLGLSSIVQGYLTVAGLSELIAKISSDFGVNGRIDSTKLINQLRMNASQLSNDEIINSLSERYRNLGLSVEIPNFYEIIQIFSKSHSRTLLVPSEFRTIQDAINNAYQYDTIIVGPGTYLENIVFQNWNIVLASRFIITHDTSFISKTIIDGQLIGTVVNMNNDSSQLIGFTIRNGWFGVDADRGVLKWLRITKNAWRGLRLGSSASISNSTISNNNDGGVGCYGKNTIYKTYIVNNDGGNFGSGIFLTNGASVNLINVTIAKNTSNYKGNPTIHLGDNNCSLTVMNSILWNPAIKEIYHYSSSDVNISYSDINDTTFNGPGILKKVYPAFIDTTSWNYNLSGTSPCLNAGNPDIKYNNLNGTRNDMGATGGK